ncbi:hypothetical protein DH2020_008342 [Rehmannia glutinosa]|uniref:BHLH domain-containing protein n=1 Tax=Rehmannia glutinosa TaxID=99300 RepID=A0ABR0U0S6_REHGL
MDIGAPCKVEPRPENPNFEMGFCPERTERKNKVKRVSGQPSKNLMAERRRRKRLNDRLSMLRSVVPKISKMDRTSILGDTIDYMKELLERINNLQEEMHLESNQLSLLSIFNDVKPNEIVVRNSPKSCGLDSWLKQPLTFSLGSIWHSVQLEPGSTHARGAHPAIHLLLGQRAYGAGKPGMSRISRRDKDTRIEICCAGKPGLLLSTVTTLEALGLEIQHCVISCFNDFAIQASCSEELKKRAILDTEDIKQALLRNAGYGGKCV